jgi:multidrug efflux pump subunit AcrA (membrane-fusion protein)
MLRRLRASQQEASEGKKASPLNRNGVADDHSSEHDETNTQSKAVLQIQGELDRAQKSAKAAEEKLTQAQAALEAANTEAQTKSTDFQNKAGIAQAKATDAQTAAAPLAEGAKKTAEQKAQEKSAREAERAAVQEAQRAEQALKTAEKNKKIAEAARDKAQAEKDEFEKKVKYKEQKLQLVKVEEEIVAIEEQKAALGENDEQVAGLTQQLAALQDAKSKLAQAVAEWKKQKPSRPFNNLGGFIRASISSRGSKVDALEAVVENGHGGEERHSIHSGNTHTTEEEESGSFGLDFSSPIPLNKEEHPDGGLNDTVVSEEVTTPPRQPKIDASSTSTPMNTAPVPPPMQPQPQQQTLPASRKETAVAPPHRKQMPKPTAAGTVTTAQQAAQGGFPRPMRHFFGGGTEQHDPASVAALDQLRAQQATAEQTAKEAADRAKAAEEARANTEQTLAETREEVKGLDQALIERTVALTAEHKRFEWAYSELQRLNPVQALEDTIRSFDTITKPVIAPATGTGPTEDDAKAKQFIDELSRLSEALKADLIVSHRAGTRADKAKTVAEGIRDATIDMLANLQEWIQQDVAAREPNKPSQIFEAYQHKYRISGWEKYGRHLGAVLAAGMMYIAMLLTFPVSVLTGNRAVQDAYHLSLARAGVKSRKIIAEGLTKNASAFFAKIGASVPAAPVALAADANNQQKKRFGFGKK